MREEEKFETIKRNLSDFGKRFLFMADLSPQEEVAFHNYIKGICQRLLGDTLDLDKQNIIFVLSDRDKANAECYHEKNLDVIFITPALFKLCENEDQLAFVLGHELGHYEETLHQGDRKINNNKAEETSCDLRAIQKMARGGYNLEEACNFAAKYFTDKLIDIEALMRDPHANDTSRLNLINAMKKKEKDRVIEEQNVEVTQSTPFDEKIMNIVNNRKPREDLPTLMTMGLALLEDQDNSDEKQIAFWMKMFHKHVFSYGESVMMAPDDMKALGKSLNYMFKKDNFSDKLLASVFAEMESLRGDKNFRYYEDIMHSVLCEAFTYKGQQVRADEEDSQTAVWLRRYLSGFRTATGDEYDKMINNLCYVEQFIYQYNDGGIRVNDFNLLELDFSEKDVGKKLSPEIVKFISLNFNRDDEFTTFSGLLGHKTGDDLLLTQKKKEWSLFVDSTGEIISSFPSKDREEMAVSLMARTIENAQKNTDAVARGEVTDFDRRLRVLHDAHNLITPKIGKNNLSDILKVRANNMDKKAISFDKVAVRLHGEAVDFFKERLSETTDNIPYSDKVNDLYAETIRSAPKEYYDVILDYFALAKIEQRLNGEDKLVRAFLDNPAFRDEIQAKIILYGNLPTDKYVNFKTSLLLGNMREITDFKLKEHLEKGGDFDSFEQPFKEDLQELFGFAPDGIYDKENMYKKLDATRSAEEKNVTLCEQAYIMYSSYDALKTENDADERLLLGFNAAGVQLAKHANTQEFWSTHVSDGFYMDDDEREHLKLQQQRNLEAVKKIRGRLTECIEDVYDKGNINISEINDMIAKNSKCVGETYGRCFETLVPNGCCEKYVLKEIETGEWESAWDSITSLSKIVSEDNSLKETDEHKEKVWPSLATVFARDDLSTTKKTWLFATMTRSEIFSSDYKNYYNVLVGSDGKGGLLSEIENIDDPTDRFECYLEFFGKYTRVPDPDIRADIIKNAAKAYWQANGEYNDITASEESRKKMLDAVESLKTEDINELDKMGILRELSELTMSQKQLSLAMAPDAIDLSVTDPKAIVAAYGLDVVAFAMQNYPDTRCEIQNFLLGEGTFDDAQKLVKEIKLDICREHDKKYHKNLTERFLNGEDVSQHLDYQVREYFDKTLTPAGCLRFKKEFDAAPLEIKALIINEIITQGSSGWRGSFVIVANKLFEDAGDLGKVGSDFLLSYIKARPQSEKTFYLAAMMAAANNKGKSAQTYGDNPYSPEQRNLAKGLRMFLENSGPAGTKLAQAMSSYSDVPDFIRYEMQFAKSQANPPARWDIFSGNDETMDKLLKHGALGKMRGSASFFVTYELGDKIVKIMRKGAKVKAENEFEIYQEMLQTLSADYENITSFRRLVGNAAENVNIETDLEVGYQQYLDAKKLYPESVKANGVEFKVQVMDWGEHGKDWAIMDKAQGLDLKDLQQPYKTAVSKAVFATELSNMLSGKRFDSDRHSGQYKFDVENNIIGVFDTGSMSVTEPTEYGRNVLGFVLAKTLKGLRKNQNVAAVFGAEIDKATKEYYEDKNMTVPPYLSEFQRGMLALNDFYCELSGKDIAECVIKAVTNEKNKIHPHIAWAFKYELLGEEGENGAIMESLLKPEKDDLLAPEVRAKRRVGKILFNAVFESISKEKPLDFSSGSAKKIMDHLNDKHSGLQIVKGVVRGAFDKINPKNYTPRDREELGMFLYEICRADVKNQKLKKEESIESIVARVREKNPQFGQYTKNIMEIVSVMSKIPSLNQEKLKKAAMMVAFADKDVSRGFKKALSEDKTVNIAKRIMLKLAPMDFVPQKSKKLLIRAIGRPLIVEQIKKTVSEMRSRLTDDYVQEIENDNARRMAEYEQQNGI